MYGICEKRTFSIILVFSCPQDQETIICSSVRTKSFKKHSDLHYSIKLLYVYTHTNTHTLQFPHSDNIFFFSFLGPTPPSKSSIRDICHTAGSILNVTRLPFVHHILPIQSELCLEGAFKLQSKTVQRLLLPCHCRYVTYGTPTLSAVVSAKKSYRQPQSAERSCVTLV